MPEPLSTTRGTRELCRRACTRTANPPPRSLKQRREIGVEQQQTRQAKARSFLFASLRILVSPSPFSTKVFVLEHLFDERSNPLVFPRVERLSVAGVPPSLVEQLVRQSNQQVTKELRRGTHADVQSLVELDEAVGAKLGVAELVACLRRGANDLRKAALPEAGECGVSRSLAAALSDLHCTRTESAE